MNRKHFTTLLIIGLLVGGIGAVVYLRSVSSWNPSLSASTTGKVLGEFPLNDVAQLTIRKADSTLTLSKKGEVWVVQERADYPADFLKVRKAIQTLWDLKTLQELKVGPSQLSRFNLLQPGSEKTAQANTGTVVELQNADSKIITTLLLGKEFLRPSPQVPEAPGMPQGRYVMPVSGSANAQASNVHLVSELLEDFKTSPQHWLDKSFFSAENIKSIELTGTSSWKLTRADATSNDWVLAEAKPEEKLDAAKVEQFGSVLSSISFTDVLPPSEKLDQPDNTLRVETFDQFTYTLKIGKARGEELPLAISVEANLPKERTAASDEKPEDKKRLDDEFAETNKRLSQKLLQEKGLENRIYLISNESLTSALKARADLLQPPPPKSTEQANSTTRDSDKKKTTPQQKP
jgi:hypothetical protein